MENITKDELMAMAIGTHYKGITIYANLDRMRHVLGEAHIIKDERFDDKINYEWIFPQEDNTKVVTTIYDWKEGTFSNMTSIKWHVGGRNASRSGIIRWLLSIGFLENEVIEDKDFNY